MLFPDKNNHLTPSACVHCLAVEACRLGRRMLLFYSSFKLPNRKSESCHPEKRQWGCFKLEHVSFHNALPFCILLVVTDEDSGTTICLKKATVKVLQGALQVQVSLLNVCCVSTCMRTGAEN